MTTVDEHANSGRKLTRRILQALSVPAFSLLTDLEITGLENLPQSGPLIIVGNHFSFIDPVCFVRLAPWQLEFVGGENMPRAPLWAKIIPFLLGYGTAFIATMSGAPLPAVGLVGLNDVFP